LSANKWRIFHRPLDVSFNFAEDNVKTCGLHYNFVRERDGYNLEDNLTVEGFCGMPTEYKEELPIVFVINMQIIL
jgi:hypothetical protein